MTKKLFSGLGTALITPFDENEDIDFDALSYLVENQIKAGVDFLVPCGTTGESPALSHKEHIEVIEHVVNTADGRVPVLAGTGSNSTREAVALTREAELVGADGALVVAPYYNKPEPAGQRDYYERIAEVGLPAVLYDIPGRTGRGVPTGLITELAQEKVIAGVKWASADQNQLMDLISKTPDDFSVLSGDDAFTFGLMALGGDGAISVLSNVFPAGLHDLISACRIGNWEHARKRHYEHLPLMRAMFLETNPIPVKTAFHLVYNKYSKVHISKNPYFRSPMSRMRGASLYELKCVLFEYFLERR